MTGLQTLLAGSGNQRAAAGGGPESVLEYSKLALRRYLLLSSGITSTALGLALIVSFLAAAYGQTVVERFTVVEGSSFQVVARNDGSTSSFLDLVGVPASNAEPTPVATPFEAAVRVVPLNLEAVPSPTLEPSRQPTAVPAPAVPRAAAARGETVGVGRIENVNLTFYDCLDQGFCGRMSSGTRVYEGAAACSWNMPAGTRFIILNDPTQRVYVCEDRGLLDDTWVDIFFHDPAAGWAWQGAVGRYGTIEVISLP